MSAGANTTDIGIRTIVINNYAKLISDKKLYFRDGNIYIHSANDGYLDLEADLGIRIGPELNTSTHSRTKQSTTLGAAATTFAITGEYIELTGDVGTNTIATITGGVTGQLIIIEFVDALVTITNDNTHAANTIDLSAALVGADDTILMLVYNGTSWYEVSRSSN